MTGVASRLGLPASAVAIAPFARRYSFFDGDRPAGLAAAMAKARIYRFIPSKVTFIDNSSGSRPRRRFARESYPFRDSAPRAGSTTASRCRLTAGTPIWPGYPGLDLREDVGIFVERRLCAKSRPFA
jgi:hypothetical protein